MDWTVGALKEGGPWLITALVAIGLLWAVLKFIVPSQISGVWEMLRAERTRNDKLIETNAEATAALNRNTAAIDKLTAVVNDQSERIKELTRDLAEARRARRPTG